MLDSAAPNHYHLAYTTSPIDYEPLGARDDRQPLPEALEQRHEPAWPHGRPHRRARSASFLTRSATRKTMPAAERCTHGLNSMSSAFYGLAKAAIDDLIDWQCWHRPPPMMPSAVHAMPSLLGPLDVSRACQYRDSMSGVHGRRGEQRGAHLQASIHHSRKDLRRLRKSCSWRTTSLLTASTFRHRS